MISNEIAFVNHSGISQFHFQLTHAMKNDWHEGRYVNAVENRYICLALTEDQR